MAYLDELQQALVKADSAGNAADAKALADEIRRQSPVVSGGPTPVNAGIANLAASVAGLPMETLKNAANLGIAGYGAIKGAMGGTPPDLIPSVPGDINSAKALLDRAAIDTGIRGFSTQNPAPQSPVGTAAYDFVSRGGAIPGGALPATASMVGEHYGGAPGAMAGALIPSGGIQAYNAARAPSLARAQAENAIRDATIRKSHEAGYVAPPYEMNPTIVNKIAEGIVGTPSLESLASSKGQSVTNALGRKALGVDQGVPINETLLEKIRADAGKSYEAIKNFGGGKIAFKPDAQFKQDVSELGGGISETAKRYPTAAKTADIEALKTDLIKGPMTPADAIELSKKLRKDSSANFKAMDDPIKLELARSQRGAADAIERLVERNLSAAGKADLIKDFRDARTTIAKTYDIESALNTATGNLNARTFAAISRRGKPLGPELQTVADFSNTFPRSSVMPEKGGNRTGIGTWDAILAAAGIGGSAVHPAIAALGIGRPLIRHELLTKHFQNISGMPSYQSALHPENQVQSLIRQGILSKQE